MAPRADALPSRSFLPSVIHRTKMKKFNSDYFLAQALTGHRNLSSYLARRKIIDSGTCVNCLPGRPEDVPHVLFTCDRWKDLGDKYKIDASFQNLQAKLKKERDSFFGFIRELLQTKPRVQ